MTPTGDDIATAPIDQAIERIRRVYRGWGRGTPVAQMRSDWDVAFGSCAVPASSERVSAGGVDAEWIAGSNARHDKTILYFHGGGFRLGSVSSHREMIGRIAEASGCRVLAINYRLAPEHRFPAALDDAVAAYDWLLSQGVSPENIVVAGDSAGGNLVLASLLSLRERGLPLPAAGVLMSPWTDLAATGESYTSRAEADPIHQRPMILALAKTYLGADGDPRHPLASPLHADLAGLPALLIQVGDRETVLDDSIMFADEARAAGIAVELQVWDGMIHVFQMFAELAEAGRAIDSIAGFIQKHLQMNAERAP
jgi:monoterpene epsilon-lactone hydrolase